MPTCPACAEELPASADACPHCGISIHSYAPGGSGGLGGISTRTVILVVVGCGLAMMFVCGGVAALLLAVRMPRLGSENAHCQNNLRQIGLALHNYHDVYNTFPPAYIPDAAGKPMHSWRVLILPFLEEQALYKDYDFSEPWDGPNNSRLLARMPAIYACPSQANVPGNTNTSYVAVFGEHCIFRGAEPVAMRDILDGTSNTLMVGEAADADIPWMKPEDIDIALHPTLGDMTGFSSDHKEGVPFLLGDCSVRFVPLTINPVTLKALFTRDGAEFVDGVF